MDIPGGVKGHNLLTITPRRPIEQTPETSTGKDKRFKYHPSGVSKKLRYLHLALPSKLGGSIIATRARGIGR